MHAYLVTGKNEKELSLRAKDLAKTLGKDFYEFSISKIDEVRDVNKFISFSFEVPVTLIIKDIENATEEAMNAFLKNLEEPQKNVQFILLATSINKITPTIVSRCQIIKSGKQNVKIEHFDSKVESFLEMSLGEKFAYTDALKKREEALTFMKELIYYWHHLLIEGKGNLSKLSESLALAQTTLDSLSANGNSTLQLTNFTIQLDRF